MDELPSVFILKKSDMQPPLPIGTLLQDRYRIVKLLGQGGFGRTYLAENQGRFNERCAIKEFAPHQEEEHFSSKATQLFQREAEILYQIQHPQIPQFRETFEAEQRLFLVQDYIEGPSYRDLLNQRRSQSSTFSEAEVRQFFQQMLPVLAHIHAKGIIHRDISPDNVLQRSQDRLPVLIDFGVVKEVVTRVQQGDTTYHATTVGKPGYAPSEQMQSGRAYPSSDLYSLAVTAAVLLTGREPQDLFDDLNLTWHWQQYATVSPSLTQVLQKAMGYRPGDRFQSVSEMAQALGAAGSTPAAAYGAPPPYPPTPAAPPPPPAAPPSQMRTMAVGRPYESTTIGTAAEAPKTSRLPTPSVLEDDGGSIWENPLAVGALAMGLAIVAGIGGWGLVSALNRNQPDTVPTPAPPSFTINPEGTDLSAPTPAPTPVAATTPEPVTFNQPLGLQTGQSSVVEGSLRTNETVNYQIEGRQGETLLAQLEGDGVLMTVLAPNGNPADGQARRVLGWTGTLDFTGQYSLQLSPVEGVEQSTYRLTASLQASESQEAPEPPAETESPNETDSPSEQQSPPPTQPAPAPANQAPAPTGPAPAPEAPQEQANVQEQRIRFPVGRNNILVANSVGEGRIRRYIVNLRQGEVLEAALSSSTGPTTFTVRLPTGEPLGGAQAVELWEGEVPAGGDYAIDVVAPETVEFTLRIQAQ